MDSNYSRLIQLIANKRSATTIIDEILKEKSVNRQVPVNSIKDAKNKHFEGCTALHIVIHDSNVQAAQKLLQHGADFTIQNAIGETALHQLINQIYFSKFLRTASLVPLVNAILDAHVKLKIFKNPCDKNGLSHFHAACIVNHEAAVKLFITENACINQAINFNSPNVPGYRPLHLAAKYSNLETFKILLNHRADIAFKNAEHLTSLHLLIQHNINVAYWMEIQERTLTDTYKKNFKKNEEMIRLVLGKYHHRKNALFDDTGLPYFHVLCTMNSVPEIEQYLSKNDVNLQQTLKEDSPLWPGYTALHFAAQLNIETVKLLLKHGINIMAKDAKDKTSFYFCLRLYKDEDIRSIVECQPDWKDIMLTDGKTSLLQLLDAMKSENSLEIFIQTVDVDISIPKSSPLWPGCTPLHVAISLSERYQGTEINTLYLERIRILLNAGADITTANAYGSTPLHTAYRLRKFEVINLLLQLNPFLFDLVDDSNVSHLQVVCAAGDLNAVQMIFQTGCVNVNLPLSSSCTFERFHGVHLTSTSYLFPAGSTPLHISVITKDLELTKLLIQNGADVHAQNAKELTPIHRLLFHKYDLDLENLATVLFSVDNLKDAVTSFGLSHLHIACWVNNKTAAEKLIDQGVDVNIKLSDLTTLVSQNQMDKQLKFVASYRYYRPINFAFCRKKSNVMDLLFERNKDILGDPKVILNAARSTKKFNTFKSFKKDHEPTFKRWEDEYKVLPLHVACFLFNVETVDELLKQGADPNAKVISTGVFWKGMTPLHVLFDVPFKAEKKINAIVKLLIDHGADSTIVNSKGDTAIHLLTDGFYFKKKQTLLLLLEGQKRFDINPEGTTEKISHFHAACMCNAASIVEKFLQKGFNANLTINPNTVSFFGGFSPIHLAAFFRAKETVNMLLKYGANVNAQNRQGNTALHFAVAVEENKFTKDREICKPLVMRLVSAEADVNISNISGETPLELLLKTQKPTSDMLKILSKNQRCVNNFNAGDGTGYIGTAISQLKTIKAIKEHHVYQAVIISPIINEMDKDRRTPLHNIVAVKKIAASIQVYTKAIEGFLKLGFDIDEQNKKGQTPLHVAVIFGNAKAVAALLTLGANMNLLCNGETPFTFHWKCFKTIGKFKLLEKERHIITLLTKQLYALQLINFDVDEMDKAADAELKQSQWGIDLKVVEQCQVELERLETRTIGRSNIPWWNLLSDTGLIASFPSVQQVERQAICDVFEKQSFRFHKEFPEFRGILHMQYRKAVKRMSLIEPSKIALLWLLDFILPDLCSARVLRFLTNNDLLNLIDAKESDFTHENKRMKIG